MTIMDEEAIYGESPKDAALRRTKSTDYTSLLGIVCCSKCGFAGECLCQFIKNLRRMPKDKRMHEWITEAK